MTDTSWEKPKAKNTAIERKSDRWKFLVGGGLMLVAVVILIVTGTAIGAQYFIGVEELLDDPSYVGQTVRISGAVSGDTIQYDSENLNLAFTISHIPNEYDDLAKALHEAVNDPDAARLPIYIENEVMPDLLQDEAQAILTGKLGADGTFYATELLLKCPSRYEEELPDQSIVSIS